MKKINRIYYSLPGLLGITKKIQDAPDGYTIDGFHYHDGSDIDRVILARGIAYYDIFPKRQFLGAFYNFAKMRKALIESIEPYHSFGKLKRDLLQPVYGVLNIFKGVAILAASIIAAALWCVLLPLTCVFTACLLPLGASALTVSFYPKILYPITWAIEGVATVVRGVAQVVCAPLVYIFKMPIRGLMNLFAPKKYAEDKPEIQRLVTELKSKMGSFEPVSKIKESLSDFNSTERQAASLLFEINRKYTKSVKDGWKTRNNVAEYQASYSSILPFFKTSAEKPKQHYQEMLFPPKISQLTQKDALSYLRFFNTADNVRKDMEDNPLLQINSL